MTTKRELVAEGHTVFNKTRPNNSAPIILFSCSIRGQVALESNKKEAGLAPSLVNLSA
jgi:hypothetical protein